MTSPGTQQKTDKGAVLALVLAFVLPPVGAALGMTGRGDQRLSGLRLVAVAVGVVLTVLTVLVLIMSFAGANTGNR
jgi:hypothetical protein